MDSRNNYLIIIKQFRKVYNSQLLQKNRRIISNFDIFAHLRINLYQNAGCRNKLLRERRAKISLKFLFKMYCIQAKIITDNDKGEEIVSWDLKMNIKRGDIYYADLSPVVGSEQGGLRPVLIVQNDVGNRHSPTVIAAAITSKMDKAKLPTHIDIPGVEAGLAKDSVILLEQMRTIDKKRLKEKMGHLDDGTMTHVNSAIQVSLGLTGGTE